MSDELVPCIVWTRTRDIRYGFAHPEDMRSPSAIVVLKNARSITRYNMAEVHGPSGLAAHGVGSTGRVGARCPQEVVHNVASIMSCTPEAVASIEAEPWTA